MPQIPIPAQRVAARSTRASGETLSANASPDDYGASVARANARVGGALADFGGAAIEIGKNAMERQRQEDIANRVAQSDFTPQMLAVRDQVGASGAGYRDEVLRKYDEFVEDQAALIDDDKTRVEYRNRMLASRPSISSNAAIYEDQQLKVHSENQANASLASLSTKLMQDPNRYDDYVEQGLDVLQARPGLTATQREAMSLKWRADAANARFTGMLEAADDVSDFDNIAAELAGTVEGGRDWSTEFVPDDFARMVNSVGTAKKAFVTAADAQARAAIETLDARNDGLAIIPQDEIAAVEATVQKSTNPITRVRFERVKRDQRILKENQTATASDLTARINAANTNPGSAYPGMPPRVSQAINTATTLFPSVSASYLGSTVTREYGGQLKVKPRATDVRYAPQAAGSNVDLTGLQPETLDAFTVAGQMFGEPFVLSSGYRTQAHQDAIRASGDPNRPSVAKTGAHQHGTGGDISTVGWSAQKKALAVASLVDAGFTGIGEYDTHIHVDLRNNVPQSFGERDGKVWGGWTYLSPEIAAVLKNKGFAAGAPSSAINRNAGEFGAANEIDYGVSNPSSTATGLFQFTEATWLENIKEFAPQIGISIDGVSDAKLLELRSDPEMSTIMAAALAQKNKSAMETTLGRTVNDGELYLAHFLGAGGALSLINTMTRSPNAVAAQLLPEAASANRKIFFEGGRPRSVQEVYDSITLGFETGQSQIAYGDVQTMTKMRTNLTTALKEDPMSVVQQNGLFDVPDITQGGDQSTYAAYGAAVKATADYYSIPMNDMKPLTAPVEAALEKRIAEGTSDQVLEVMAQLESMGADVARAAMAQLGEKDAVFGFAGGLALDGGNPAAAADVIRGQKRIQDNPAIKTSVGQEAAEMTRTFNSVVGGSLSEIAPRDRQAIEDAAFAHYVETYVARSGAAGFNQQAYQASVSAVLGGANGRAAIEYVNGVPTVMPPGIDAVTLETAMERMTVADWTAMSPQKVPPLDADGVVLDPRDLAIEAQLLAVGGGVYKVRMGDGSFAITGNMDGGRFEAYLFQPDPDTLSKAAARPTGDATGPYPSSGTNPYPQRGTNPYRR